MKLLNADTITGGHFMNFLNNTINELNNDLLLKDCYLILDNAPIRRKSEIGMHCFERNYRCLFLPPYSPELNPIENFWSVIKS
ncbi:unnamed protein product [Cunninghamella echinulata]